MTHIVIETYSIDIKLLHLTKIKGNINCYRPDRSWILSYVHVSKWRKVLLAVSSCPFAVTNQLRNYGEVLLRNT